MRGLIVYGNNELKLVDDLPVPEVSDYTALVKTFACGICNGTDTKLAAGHLNGFSTYPAILGHETVGEVIKVGSRVTKYKVGDHVLRCGCPATDGYYSLWGGFAEYTLVTDYEAMLRETGTGNIGEITEQVIPSEIDTADATMIITVKEVYSAMKRLGVFKDSKIAICGCGPVGLAIVLACRLLGASFIALSGHHDNRISIAKKLGADIALNSRNESFSEAVLAACPEKLDFYIDAVGRCDTVSEALSLIKDDAVIGIYGIGIEDDKGISWSRGPYNFKIHSVQWPVPQCEADVHDEVIASVLDGRTDLTDFVSHKLPVEKFEEGFRLVRSREGLKVVLTF